LDELKEAAAPAVATLRDDERGEIAALVTTLSGNLDKIAEHGRRADGIVTSMLANSRGTRSLIDTSIALTGRCYLAYVMTEMTNFPYFPS
jgi:hypothetical protein